MTIPLCETPTGRFCPIRNLNGGATILRDNSNQDWIKLGRKDPYFAVLTAEKYHLNNLNEETLKDFFSSGQQYIDFIFSMIHSRLDPAFRPRRTLDFGCGVGRLMIPLAALSDSVVGLDVAPEMLREAKKNCEARGISNVELVRSDDSLSNVTGTFDLIHSFIVFQHIPNKRGEKLMRRLIQRLDEKGIGALHFTYHTASSKPSKFLYRARRSFKLIHKLLNLREGNMLNSPLIQMNDYDLNKLLYIIQEEGCRYCYLHYTRHSNHFGAILFFQKGGRC